MLSSTIADFAGLRCRVIDALPADQVPKKVVILCHGFGASGEDLVPLGPALIDNSSTIEATCRFVFPAAPLDLASEGMPGGRAWWKLNMARLAMMQQTQDFSQLTLLRPDGMVEASTQLVNAVRAIQTAYGVTDTQTVLGGFSQGAMVSTDVVLRQGLVPSCLVLFSGTLLCRDEWQNLAEAHPGCPVMQSHGRQDPVLPFAPAESLRDLLQTNGFGVDFRAFHGQHTIPLPAMEDLQRILQT